MNKRNKPNIKIRKKRSERKSGVGSILRHYIFLWPSLRYYYTIFLGHFKKEKNTSKKEKITIIED